MSDIGIIAAFLGGLLALLSPCSALLLPAFFACSFTSRTTLLARTLLFYAGLCATLVPLGVAGSLAGRLFYGHRDTLVTVGGWTVILLGVAQVLGLGFGVRRLSEAAGARRSGSARSVFVLGAVYGLAGFCAGPILGGILTARPARRSLRITRCSVDADGTEAPPAAASRRLSSATFPPTSPSSAHTSSDTAYPCRTPASICPVAFACSSQRHTVRSETPTVSATARTCRVASSPACCRSSRRRTTNPLGSTGPRPALTS
nr:cytochrome c biogenesis protein CcdA [Streptomyces anulatus]